MAKRLALGECDQLHHFIAAGVLGCNASGNRTAYPRQIGSSAATIAVLVIDDTAITQERHAFGGCCCAICFGAGQDRQLPDLGIADAWRAGEVPVMLGLRLFSSSRELDEQSSSAEASGCSNRISNGADEAGAGSGRDRFVSSRPVCASAACWRMPVMG